MHPEIGIPRETNFIRELWWQRIRFGDLADPANRRRVAEWIFGDPDHLTRRLTHKRLDRTARRSRRSPRRAPTIGSVVERCLRLHAHDKPRWGDKRPAYSGFIGPLFRMFPDALYVNVVRDPRGATASQLTMGWDEPQVAVATAAVRWEFAIRATDHAPRARCVPTSSSTCATRTSSPTRSGSSSGSSPSPASPPPAGSWSALAHGDRDGWFRGPHLQAGEPITAAPVERWRERLTPADVALVEHVAAGVHGAVRLRAGRRGGAGRGRRAGGRALPPRVPAAVAAVTPRRVDPPGALPAPGGGRRPRLTGRHT